MLSNQLLLNSGFVSVNEELKLIEDYRVFKLVKWPVDARVVLSFLDENEYELKETYVPVSRVPVIRLAIINKLDINAGQINSHRKAVSINVCDCTIYKSAILLIYNWRILMISGSYTEWL